MTEQTIKTGQCTCGATVIGTGGMVTVEGEEIARCAVCRWSFVVVR